MRDKLEIEITTYELHTSKPEEGRAYLELCRKIRTTPKAPGFPFTFITSPSQIKANGGPVESGVYEVECDSMFAEQFNTAGDPGRRLFVWCEHVYNHGSAIKRGYYVSAGLDKLRARQAQRLACGYCGRQYWRDDAPGQWCARAGCLGNEYLKEAEYPLLELLPVYPGDRIRTTPPPAGVLSSIEAAQEKRRESERLREVAAAEKELESAQQNLEAVRWLVARGYSAKNMIQYSHRKGFYFGRNGPVSEALLSHLADGFPFEYRVE